MNWSVEDLSDLGSRVCVVTGANSGIGFETTKNLASKGATVVMACKNLEKAKKAREEIIDDFETADLRIMELDLASLDSIHSFANRYTDAFDRLDVMVNNAGVMMVPWKETAFGFEYQFGVNYLGHFALNSKLIDCIKSTKKSRVVSVTSLYHREAEMDLENINSRQSYSKQRAYADSKMANLMYSIELNERFRQNDVESISLAAHPGYSDTNLQKKAGRGYAGFLGEKIASAMNKILGQPPHKGALPVTYAAVSTEVNGGELIGPDGWKKMRGDPEIQEPDERALDPALRDELWAYSEKQLDLDFKVV